MRNYLSFSPHVQGIMAWWSIADTGQQGYRRGYCLPKIIYIFTPVRQPSTCLHVCDAWYCVKRATNLCLLEQVFLTTMIQAIILTPALQMAFKLPKLQKSISRAMKFFGLTEPTPEEQLDALVWKTQLEVANVMTNGVIAFSWGALSPIVLLFASIMSPLSSFAHAVFDESKLAEELPSDMLFCIKVVLYLKVPIPQGIPSKMLIMNLWLAILAVLLDLGFSLGSFALLGISSMSALLLMRVRASDSLGEQTEQTYRRASPSLVTFTAVPPDPVLVKFVSASGAANDGVVTFNAAVPSDPVLVVKFVSAGGAASDAVIVESEER